MGSGGGRKEDAEDDLQVSAWSSWVVLVTATGKGGMGRDDLPASYKCTGKSWVSAGRAA